MLRDYLNLPRPVHILCLGMLLNRAGSFFVVFLTIYLRAQLGFSVRFATLAIGVAGLGAMVGSIIGGQLADQIGRRVVMLIALFGSAATLLGLSFVRSPTLFLVGMFAFSCVVDMYRPAASAMIGDLVAAENRQYSFGLMYVSINLGFAIAPPIGGVLTEYSWQWLFWGDALTTALFGCLIFFVIRETHPGQPGNPIQPVSPGQSVQAESVQAESGQAESGQAELAEQELAETSVLAALIHMVSDTTFMVFCLATFLNSLVFMQSLSTLPLAMTEIGMTPSQFGCLMSVNGVLIVVVQLPLTQWLSRFDRMSVIAAGGFLIAVGFGANYFVSRTTFETVEALGVGVIVSSVVIWTFGEMFQAPFKQAVITDLAPVALRGRYLGAFSMTYATACAIGAPIGGAIMQTYGPATLWKICFWIGIAAVTLYCMLRSGVQRRTNLTSH